MAKKKKTRNQPRNQKKARLAKAEFNELMVAGKSTMGATFSDQSMEATPQNIKLWIGLTRDHQVASAWQQRQLAILAVDWEVIPGGEDPRDIEAADFLREQISQVSFDQAFRKMNYGQFYGFSVAECLWGQDGAYITLDAIKVRSRERFRFDRKTGDLLFTGDGSPQGTPLPECKMWTYCLPGDCDDIPHGPPLGWQLYWPVFLKQNGSKFWAIALEKFGMPTAKGSFPAGSSKADQDLLLETLLSVHGQSAIAVPEGFLVELMTTIKTFGDEYEAFQSYWDKAVTKIILSQTMTTDDGSSKSQATVHQGVRDEVIQSDADLICESFNNTVARWLTEWNFPGAKLPQVWRRISQAEDLGKRAARDKAISEASGLRPTKEYVEETYGGKWMVPSAVASPPVSSAALLKSAVPEFADSDDDDDKDDITSLAGQLGDLTDPMFADMIDGVKFIMDSSTDLEDFQRRLLAFADKIDNKPMAKMLVGGLAVADLAGRASVGDS